MKAQGVIKNVKYFKLNNSVYQADPMKMDKKNNSVMMMNKMYWEMGTMCFDELFKAICATQTKSMTCSRQVLTERDMLNTSIDMMSSVLDFALEKTQELERHKTWIKSHEAELNAFKKVEYEVTVLDNKREYTGSTIITTCTVCANKTCHPGCRVSNKERCCMMGNGGYCSVCKCHWSKHENRSYKWVKVPRKEKRTNKEMKGKFDKAKSDISASEQMMKETRIALEQQDAKVQRMVAGIQQGICKLEKIALRPDPTTVGDYIDELIELEKVKKKKDPERMKQLLKLKAQERNIVKIQEAEGEWVAVADLLAD